MRKPPKGKSLAEVDPILAKEWHPLLNKDLVPSDISSGSDRKVWWKCPEGDDHEWQAAVGHRTRGRGCPICVGKKVVKSNCLATTHPEVSKIWHPTKNGKLTPFDVTSGSSRKVWWKCHEGADHEWQASVANKAKGRGCPVCSGNKVVKSNCLMSTHPNIAKQWHPTKNGNLTPYDTTMGNTQKFWWKCSQGDDHEWLASPNSRKNTDCPVCAGRKVVMSNSLLIINPELAKEWHPTKNGQITPSKVTANTSKRVWWLCSKNNEHEWRTSISHRVSGTNCPFCLNQKVSRENCLANTYPKIAIEWHPTKNGDLTPFDVTSGTSTKVWWKCPKGNDHEWKTPVSGRTGSRKTGCPICFGTKVVKSNSLEEKFPKIANEVHPTKNKNIRASDLYYSSSRRIWWKCSKGEDHEWKTSITHRTVSKSKCPFCTLTPQSRQELTISFELMRFFNINPMGFKTRVEGKLISIDIYIPELNLGIEFDGSYWHKGRREIDKLKTEKLKNDGFNIMRVREEPLKPITEIDVISKKPFNAKIVTNEILTHIMEAYTIDSKRIKKIEKYLLKQKVQNEKGLDAYIDIILTEKAEKNNHK